MAHDGCWSQRGFKLVTRSQDKITKYKIHLHDMEEGFDFWVPALPGCCFQGDTEQQALENITDATREYLEATSEPIKGVQVREVEISV